ncbi:unnamed protein product [Adineta steineri]|uniref:Uncharacterized protein n=1 Tax=Adineta steineri TaxID=433720 RepID=A0A814PGG0_9BILA|nr:unnamed protein product [Adineta steineri]CAF3693196.1 unnamed protein product [Adineta steineri]
MAYIKGRRGRWSSPEKSTIDASRESRNHPTPFMDLKTKSSIDRKPQSTTKTPSPPKTMTQQVLLLAEKINDQYLTCKICLEPFKDPKCLTCLHTFCEECIESHVSAQRSYKYTDYREFACPICRKKTSIPAGGVHKLPDNFLVAGLSEMITQKSPGSNGSVRVLSNCEICKAVHDRDREATSRCLECQKFLCRHCVQAHQTINITRNHQIYELEIEKDIQCKHHPTESVRYYCEQCEACICIACTYADHRDHELIDFRTAAANHKAYIIDCLENCKIRMNDLEIYMNVIRQCDANIAQIEAGIHALATTFEKSLRIKEQELVQQIWKLYGEETDDFIKRREELDEFYEQIKNTCSLTELVIHGKDIELLLVKKQLLEKFHELESVELDPLPDNLNMHIKFQPGQLNLGTLTICEMTPTDDDECEGELDEDDEEDRYEEQKSTIRKTNHIVEQKKSFATSATQTEDVEITTQAIQTMNGSSSDSDLHLDSGNLSMSSLPIDENGTSPITDTTSSPSTPSSDNDTNLYDQSNKLSRRVRRLLKPTCSVAVLPNTDVIILDCEQNLVSILDKKGKFKYCFTSDVSTAEQKGFAVGGFSSTASISNAPAGANRTVRIPTQQGLLCIKLKNERVSDLPFGFTVHAFNSISETDN